MGLIFVTAGEAIAVACGSAKTLNLPEWAKLISRLKNTFQQFLYRFLSKIACIHLQN
jgi:hypothetical protein